MKGLIQRVTHASVQVDGELIADISAGLLVLLGVDKKDGPEQAEALCKKILTYRVFPDAQGRMNRSLLDCGGSLLVVPQFTLAADTRTGTRPGFSNAASPAEADLLFCYFLQQAIGRLGAGYVESGWFGADMQVSLVNDGPVTFLLEVLNATK